MPTSFDATPATLLVATPCHKIHANILLGGEQKAGPSSELMQTNQDRGFQDKGQCIIFRIRQLLRRAGDFVGYSK